MVTDLHDTSWNRVHDFHPFFWSVWLTACQIFLVKQNHLNILRKQLSQIFNCNIQFCKNQHTVLKALPCVYAFWFCQFKNKLNVLLGTFWRMEFHFILSLKEIAWLTQATSVLKLPPRKTRSDILYWHTWRLSLYSEY